MVNSLKNTQFSPVQPESRWMPEAIVMLILMRIIIFLIVAFQDVSAVKFSAGNRLKSGGMAEKRAAARFR
ncbi:hypothetical protein DSL62_07730 [Pantoea sp. 3_1284]|nr:hypothetical protein DSL62_07730 [Pantoea sp. 3_1284]